MSGIIGSKINIRGSSRIAKLGTDGQVLTSSGAGVQANYEDVAGGISWQAVVTASTMTAVAGEGYWIDTTSNTCTITLPSSASVGDTIIFADYARNWGTNKIIIDSNGLKYQSDDDTFDVEYSTDGQTVKITYMDATQGWVPTLDKTVTDAPTTTQGIFGFGNTGSPVGMTNLVSNAGVVASDVTAVGTARERLAACEYGGDKGIFGYGNSGSDINETNLVSNVGVVATDTTGVGTNRERLAACEYGGDKGIFGYGDASASVVSVSNLVSNAGVVASDVTSVAGTNRLRAACGYGGDKGIFGFGYDGSGNTGVTNLVSNVGVVATDVTAVGTARHSPGATQYGGDKGIFGFGNDGSATAATNLVSNAGVVATDVTGVGTGRWYIAACSWG